MSTVKKYEKPIFAGDLKITKSGETLYVRIPKEVAERNKLVSGGYVRVEYYAIAGERAE